MRRPKNFKVCKVFKSLNLKLLNMLDCHKILFKFISMNLRELGIGTQLALDSSRIIN